MTPPEAPTYDRYDAETGRLICLWWWSLRKGVHLETIWPAIETLWRNKDRARLQILIISRGVNVPAATRVQLHSIVVDLRRF